jgi:hypothetical protein
MFFLPHPHVQMAQGMPPQVQGVEVAHGILRPVRASVVGGSLVPVTITGIEIEVGEIRVSAQGIRPRGGDPLAQAPVELGREAEAARTFEGFKVVASRGAVGELEAVLLEVRPTGRDLVQDAVEAQVNPRFIGEFETTALVRTRGHKVVQRAEKDVVDGRGGRSKNRTHLRSGKNISEPLSNLSLAGPGRPGAGLR